MTIWHALYAPRARRRGGGEVNKALRASLKDADFIKAGSAGRGGDHRRPRGSAEHKKFVAAEINKWGPVIKAASQYAD